LPFGVPSASKSRERMSPWLPLREVNEILNPPSAVSAIEGSNCAFVFVVLTWKAAVTATPDPS
jgi:hypothetical protein